MDVLKNQNWKSLGRVFCANGQSDWMYTHASYPVVVPALTKENELTILYSPRDTQGRSHIGWLKINLEEKLYKVVAVGDKPILSPGARGSFDDSGVTIGSAVPSRDGVSLYYLGWSLGRTVPFTNFIGLANIKDNMLTAERIKRAPIIGRSEDDLYTLGYPWVMKVSDYDWRMWYGSHRAWGAEGLQMEHVIKMASSENGIDWKTTQEVAIDIMGGDEYAVSRPCVMKRDDGYHMWYARRHEIYKPGYAFSIDGYKWERNDSAFHFSGQSDWDSDAITYMAVFEHLGRLYMLYNGNGYGQTGFGIAILDGDKY